MRSVAIFVVLAGLLATALADVYMHHPRGSNNRYSGNNNNQNRLFDSQNNNNGGYGWGPEMTYYAGSLLQVEWTSQHGCGAGGSNTDCEIVLQYMCGPWIRDGTTDNTPPTNIMSLPLAQQLQFGYHEPVTYYRDCINRERNKGLFIADQNIGDGADQTRQNDNNRRGFECDEERDYYPYWHPSPWKDIAILTSGPLMKRCPYYRQNTQNTTPKGHCVQATAPDYVKGPFNFKTNVSSIQDVWGFGANENNQDACMRASNTWVVVPSWGIDPPECIPAPVSRDNHLGNADFAASTAFYRWVIPTPDWDDPTDPNPKATCVFRLRYNISSEDYFGWGNVDGTGPLIDAQFNGQRSPVRNNPTVNFGRDPDQVYRNLTLAIDTSQFGRTFQDRSHRFYIKPRPAGVPLTTKIWNLNVRGKRGNIVQTYPSVEYDFVPTNFRISRGDKLHIQWTGSDTNPAGNAGEGRDQTDRSNIVQLARNGDDRRKNYPMSIEEQSMFYEPLDAFRVAHLDQGPVCNSTCEINCCRTLPQLVDFEQNGCPSLGLAAENRNQQVQNCQKLNFASAYFNGGLIDMLNMGTFHYISSRNNNFTNRSQKATLVVQTVLPPVALGAVVVGSAAFAGAAVIGGGVWYAKSHAASSVANIFGHMRV